MSERDERIRLAAVESCKRLADVWGEAVPYGELKNGFVFENQRIMLIGPQGIFKPKEMENGPLTLTSTIGSPYEDEEEGPHADIDTRGHVQIAQFVDGL